MSRSLDASKVQLKQLFVEFFSAQQISAFVELFHSTHLDVRLSSLSIMEWLLALGTKAALESPWAVHKGLMQ